MSIYSTSKKCIIITENTIIYIRCYSICIMSTHSCRMPIFIFIVIKIAIINITRTYTRSSTTILNITTWRIIINNTTISYNCIMYTKCSFTTTNIFTCSSIIFPSCNITIKNTIFN